MWKEEEYGHGKCVNCGYLGKKDIEGFGEICFTASMEDRTTGQLVHHNTFQGGLTSLDTVPWCFVGKANLKDEVDQLDSQETEDKRIFNIITKRRDCPSWYPWREFASPREQWEESMMLAMEKRREEFEQRMEQERRDFELKLEEINRHERRRTNYIMIFLGIAALIFAAMEVYTTLGSINPEHWLFDWFR